MRLPIGTKRISNDGWLCRQAGLTLIELTLVTLLVLALIGLSIPIFKKTFSDLSAKNTSFSISKLINYAQEIAVLEGKIFKISFDFQKGKYQLLEMDASKKPPVYKKVKGRFGRLFGLPQGLTLHGEKREIIFYPDGHCDEFMVKIRAKVKGYIVHVKRFGNMVEIKPFDQSSGFYPEPVEG